MPTVTKTFTYTGTTQVLEIPAGTTSMSYLLYGGAGGGGGGALPNAISQDRLRQGRALVTS